MIIFYFVAGIFLLSCALCRRKSDIPGTGWVMEMAGWLGVAAICFGFLGVVHALLSR
jgi:hypothetical protein